MLDVFYVGEGVAVASDKSACFPCDDGDDVRVDSRVVVSFHPALAAGR